LGFQRQPKAIVSAYVFFFFFFRGQFERTVMFPLSTIHLKKTRGYGWKDGILNIGTGM
jgi:hypothetical protein